jgi:hypothetical protein
MCYKYVNLYQKTIPQETVSKSISVLVFSLAAICIAVFLIVFLKRRRPSPRMSPWAGRLKRSRRERRFKQDHP